MSGAQGKRAGLQVTPCQYIGVHSSLHGHKTGSTWELEPLGLGPQSLHAGPSCGAGLRFQRQKLELTVKTQVPGMLDSGPTIKSRSLILLGARPPAA